MSLFLGIDTSAYTTSIAIVDHKFNIILDERKILDVEKGQRGLRQSDALFLHIKNLPLLFEKITRGLPSEIRSVAVSKFPRRVEGSYMPVFTAGYSHAVAISKFTGAPLCAVSHQEGHIMAGILANPALLDREEFLAVHFSGGTSEILHVKKQGKTASMDIKVVAAGMDLHAGQLVDRVGVAMGLPFPAGKTIEKMALQSDQHNIPLIPSTIKGEGFCFSGAETRALQLVKQGECKEDIAYAVLRVIANTLEKILLVQTDKLGIKDVLLVGGVMANSLIRERLVKRLEHPAVGLNLYFAEPLLSTDNAVGVAFMAACADQSE
ncbi:MAG: peptidase M22 [Syntrophomonadaceae bacterium]|nr:peptidase M22 [Syntrophomonadaceae bacterium]MDD3888507.1 peptidase M22 [Syntrophomonadaceae bacterium]MDD4548747.1 peptidase M22 [Syntrophomonadaceae bacterium]